METIADEAADTTDAAVETDTEDAAVMMDAIAETGAEAAADTVDVIAETITETAAKINDHVHSAACYQKVLACEQEEHIHTIECLSDVTADVETAQDWEATLPEQLSEDRTEAVAAVAQSQAGYTESILNFILADDGETHKGYTRYGAWAGNEYGDWSAMFASFCLHYAGISTGDFPESTGTYAWVVMLKEQGLYAAAMDYIPGRGDLVFFDTDEDGRTDRVGIVIFLDEESEQMTVIEGDYAPDADTIDAVCTNQYAISDSRIIGYGTVSAALTAADGAVSAESAAQGESDTSSSESAAQEESDTLSSEPAVQGASETVASEYMGVELTGWTLTMETDGIILTISGLLPENATVSAEPVDVEIEGKNVLLAFDISILYFEADGSETVYEPQDGTVTVTIEADEITGSSSVYYIPDEGEPEILENEAKDGVVSFDAEHFSTYAIAGDATVIVSGDCSASETDNVSWTLYSDGSLVIDGEGAMAD